MSDWALDRFDPQEDLSTLKDAARAYLWASGPPDCCVTSDEHEHYPNCSYRLAREALEALL